MSNTLPRIMTVLGLVMVSSASWGMAARGQRGSKKDPGVATTRQCMCCTKRSRTRGERAEDGKVVFKRDPHSKNSRTQLGHVQRQRAKHAIKGRAPVPATVAETPATRTAPPPQGTPAPAEAAPIHFGTRPVSEAVLTYVKEHEWFDHHGPWHAIHRWADLSPGEQEMLTREGINPPRDASGNVYKQEGEPLNGTAFMAMHGGMFRGLAGAGHAADIAMWTPQEWTALKEHVMAGVAHTVDLLYELIGWQPDPRYPSQRPVLAEAFHSFDDFANWVQTQRGASRLAIDPAHEDLRQMAGVHNMMHVALMDSSYQFDMGNPGTNLGNRDFWGWHGVIDAAKDAYLTHFATPEERAAFEEAVTEELARMDPQTPEGQRVARLGAKFKAIHDDDSHPDQPTARSIMEKAHPVARRVDLPTQAMREGPQAKGH